MTIQEVMWTDKKWHYFRALLKSSSGEAYITKVLILVPRSNFLSDFLDKELMD